MIGVILAAGNGNRLKASKKDNLCKPLTKIQNIPLIEFSLENLLKLKIRQVCIVIGTEGEQIKQVVGDNYKGITVTYVSQPEPKGLIHALMHAVNDLSIEESIVLQLSDEIFIGLRANDLLHSIETGDFDFICGITMENNEDKIKANFSVETDCDDVLISCKEKPAVVTNKRKGTGFCYFEKDAVHLLKTHYNKDMNTPRDLCDFMNMLIQEKQRGLVLCIAEKEFNINTASDLIEAEEYYRESARRGIEPSFA